MYSLLLKKLAALLSALSLLLIQLQGTQPKPIPQSPPIPLVHIMTTQGAVAKGIAKLKFGAVGSVDNIAAYFDTYLAAGITGTATSLTLGTSTTVAGNALPAGTYGFVIDQGTTQQEVVRGVLSGTSVTALVRGVDPANFNATSSILQQPHSRGADIKITDYPIIGQVVRLLQGSDTLPSTLQYTNHPVAPASTTIIDKNYVDTVATSGAADAGIGAKGLVQLATNAQTAAGATSTSDGANTLYYSPQNGFFNQTSTATTTVPVTNGSGTLSSGFIDQTATYTWSGTSTFSGAVRINASSSINATTTLTANLVGSQFIPLLSSSVVSSTINFTTSTGAGTFVTIGSSTASGIASTTITLTSSHRVALSFVGTNEQSASSQTCAVDFTIDGTRQTSGNSGMQKMGTGAAALIYPISISYVTPTLSAAVHTFRAVASGGSGICTVGEQANAATWVFSAIELYN